MCQLVIEIDIVAVADGPLVRNRGQSRDVERAVDRIRVPLVPEPCT